MFPPVLLFVVLAAYNMLTFGVRFANTGSRYAPRTGRVRVQERVFGEDYGAAQASSSHGDSVPVTARKPGESLSVLGITCAVFGIFFFHSTLGVLGMALGMVGIVRGVRRLGAAAVTMGAAVWILGQIL